MKEGTHQQANIDRRAQEAARLMHMGEAADIADALSRLDPGPAPSAARIRRHLDGLRQSSVGLGQWWRDRLVALEAVVEVVETVQYLAPQCTVLLTGQTAQGHVDSMAPASARVIGVSAPALADALEHHGMPPPDVRALQTTVGSMSVVQVTDRRGHGVDLLVLPDVPEAHRAVNLVDGAKVSMLDLEQFGTIVEAARRTTEQFSGNNP